MEESDTIKLLKECDAGSKMAVATIDEVLEKASGTEVKQILSAGKEHHSKLGNEIHSLLKEHSSDDKEPNPIAKSMSWMKTNMKMTMNESDATIADLIIDGCNMGVKTLNKYLNQYKAADEKSKEICNELIETEQKMCDGLKKFL